MFGLELGHVVLLIVLVLATCIFEFINGFHDTANAVATVIYTNSLKPRVAVIWSGIWNFIGVYVGGIAVAMGIINLLPTEMLIDHNVSHGVALIAALMVTAIMWNGLTWYFGIPCSSSHTLIGSIFGVGLSYMILNPASHVSLNWTKVIDTGLSLLVSPMVGFALALTLMFLLSKLVSNAKIFKEPKEKKAPPFWIRSILVITSTSVSFSHGSNDGQKGVGMMMLILIGLAPGYFALNHNSDPQNLLFNLDRIETSLSKVDHTRFNEKDTKIYTGVIEKIDSLKLNISPINSFKEVKAEEAADCRKDLILIFKGLKKLEDNNKATFSSLGDIGIKRLHDDISSSKEVVEFAPGWVIILISISLGLGTMIGWKRIVVTISEKIGKTHLSYAQGMSSEIIAASTIGLSSAMGVPVSTTHVLSSGIAGSMVARGGLSNLQMRTVKVIGIAWLVTLPVTIVTSGLLFALFRYIL
ncbi:MAG: inorganic phosphate transporter [Bacteroidota bacterium]|nr:inorganic phosphate transporter [Bacteroidota bacterium]